MAKFKESHLIDVYSYMDAEIIMSLLKSEGIPAYKKVHGPGEYINIVFGGNIAVCLIEIFVSADDYDKAKAIIDAEPAAEE